MFTCCTLGVDSLKDAWLHRHRGEWSYQVRTGETVCPSGPHLLILCARAGRGIFVVRWASSKLFANEESP